MWKGVEVRKEGCGGEKGVWRCGKVCGGGEGCVEVRKGVWR